MTVFELGVGIAYPFKGHSGMEDRGDMPLENGLHGSGKFGRTSHGGPQYGKLLPEKMAKIHRGLGPRRGPVIHETSAGGQGPEECWPERRTHRVHNEVDTPWTHRVLKERFDRTRRPIHHVMRTEFVKALHVLRT